MRTQKFGKLNFIGYLNVKKLGGYKGLKQLLSSNDINYDVDTISASYGKFGGGQIYENEDLVIISSYSRLVKPRWIGLRELYVYKLYIIDKDDYQKIKGKLPIQRNWVFHNSPALIPLGTAGHPTLGLIVL